MDLSDNDSDATVLDEEEEARGQIETVPSNTEHQDELGINSPPFLTTDSSVTVSEKLPCASTNSPSISLKPSYACTNSPINSLKPSCASTNSPSNSPQHRHDRHFTSCQPNCINLPLDSGGTQSEALITPENDHIPCQHQTQQTAKNTLEEAVPVKNASQIDPQEKQIRSDVIMQVVMESPGAPINSTVSSPSLLHTSLQSLLERRSLSEPSGERVDRPNVKDTSIGDQVVASVQEEVQFSNDEESDAMSQEFPPPTTTVNKSSVPGEKSGTLELSTSHCKVYEPDSVKELSLKRVLQTQDVILSELCKPLSSVSMPQQLEETKKKVLVIEANLKAISTANQAERKRLAGAHSMLSQHTNSQQEFLEGSQTLRQQLLTLANKQKQLLDCFTKQKVIGSHISKLSSRLVPKKTDLTRVMVDMSSNIQRPSNDHTLPIVSDDQHATVTSRSVAVSKRDLSSLQRLQVSRQNSRSAQSMPGANHNENYHINPLPTASQVSHLLQEPAHPVQPSAAVKGSRMAPSKLTDLAHPVPLETLIEHGFIEPGVNCLSCVILGCEFKSSLVKDGTIREQPDSTNHQGPTQWMRSCWAKLGHPNKKPSRKITYNCVLYKGTPLITFCEKYSLKQVSSYLSQQSVEHSSSENHQHRRNDRQITSAVSEYTLDVGDGDLSVKQLTGVFSMNVEQSDMILETAPTPTVAENQTHHRNKDFNLGQLLTRGSVFLINPVSKGCSTSLNLPMGFWKQEDVRLTPKLIEQIEADLEW